MLNMKYQYKDTFTKECNFVNNIIECSRSRDTIKCTNDICVKIKDPKKELGSKIQVLKEYYDYKNQVGSGPIDKYKYKCPVCGSYEAAEGMLRHIKEKHQSKEKQLGIKYLTGGCSACMIGSGIVNNQISGCFGCKHECTCQSQVGGLGPSPLGESTKLQVIETRKTRKKDVNNVKNHLIHNLKNKYKCPMCHRYKYLDTMESHMKKYHTININKLGSGKKQYYGKKSSIMVNVPDNVRKTAMYSFKLKLLGFKGGKETGWKRAKQLATKESISIEDLKYIRAWFARHIYTSYPGYLKWVKGGKPKEGPLTKSHGTIAWLIWGGNAAFKWVNSNKNIKLLNKHYPGKDYKRISKKLSGGSIKKRYSFPRKFSKTHCSKKSCNKMGFTEKASCRPYKNCYK
jgi:hypothetical protein